MRFIEFANTVRRRTRSRSDLGALKDPLAALVELIEDEPHTPSSGVLSRVITALSQWETEFQSGDLFSLDADAITLLDALIVDWCSGRYTPAELQGAARSVERVMVTHRSFALDADAEQ